MAKPLEIELIEREPEKSTPLEIELIEKEPKESTPLEIELIEREPKESSTLFKPVDKEPSGGFDKYFVSPLKGFGLRTASDFSEGMGGFSANIDSLAQYVGDKLGVDKTKKELFKEGAKWWMANHEKLSKMADEEGTTRVDDFLASAIGHGVPGIANFMLHVPWAMLEGARDAKNNNQNEVAGAIIGGLKRALLGGIFHAAGRLKLPYRATTMGGTFGVQTAFEGGNSEEVAESVGVGVLYSLFGKGKMGYKEFRDLHEGVGAQKVILKVREFDEIIDKAKTYNNEIEFVNNTVNLGKTKASLRDIYKSNKRWRNAKGIEAKRNAEREILADIYKEAKSPEGEHVLRQSAFEEATASGSVKEPFTGSSIGTAKGGLLRRIYQKYKISGKKAQADIKSRAEMIKMLEKDMGIPIRFALKRFTKKGHMGSYYPDSEWINIRKGIDDYIGTVYHELFGHHLHKFIWGRNGSGYPLYLKDLEPFAHELAPKATSGNPLAEGFAEYMRAYTKSKKAAKEDAPEFYKYFEGVLDEYFPDIKQVIDTSRADYQRWKNAPDVQKTLAQISYKTERKGLDKKDWYRKAVDGLSPMSDMVKEIMGFKGRHSFFKDEYKQALPFSKNPYILQRVLKGYMGLSDHFFMHGVVDFHTRNIVSKPLNAILKRAEKHLRELDAYLVSKRQIILEPRGIRSGVGESLKHDIEIAKNTIKILEKDHPYFKEIYKDLQEYQNNLLKYLRDSGAIDKKSYAKMKASNPEYVPWYRISEDMFSPIKSIGKKAAHKQLAPPVESIVKNTYVFLLAAERYVARKALVDMAKREGSGKWIIKASTPMKPIKVGIKEVLDKIAKEFDVEQFPGIEGVITLFRPNHVLPKNSRLISVNNKAGKAEYYEVQSESLYESLDVFDRESAHWMLKLLSKPAATLRAGATLSPEFILRNPLRDQFMAYVQSKYGFTPVVSLVKGIFSAVKMDKYYTDFKLSGADHSMLSSLDRKYIQKQLQDILHPIRIVRHPFEVLKITSELMEVGTRLGEFRKAMDKEIKAGVGRKEALTRAGFAAREVSLDFARIGAKMQGLNMIVAFWNARLQGHDKMIRTFRDNPVEATARAVLSITAPSVAFYFANRDDPRYWELPDWQRDLFWIIFTDNMTYGQWAKMTPEERAASMGGIYRIPKPFELGVVFGSFFERILQYIDGRNPEAMKEFLHTFAEASQPVDIPTGLKAPIENWKNWSIFLERPLFPRHLEELEPEFQKTPYTSQFAQKIGEAIGYSPAKIENIIRGYGGGMGMLGVEGIDKIMEVVGITDLPPQPEKGLSDLPGFRGFKIKFPTANTKSIRDLYSYYSKSKSKYKSYITYTEVNPDKAEAYYEKNKEFIDNAQPTGNAIKQFKGYYEWINDIYQDREMPPKKKKQVLDAIYFEMIDLAQEVLKYLKEERELKEN